jgi:glutamyl-Q tRNA(Asp) synthetase
VRIEDLDRVRTLPDGAAQMLRTLDRFGLHWDGAVEYQSHRTAGYEQALKTLQASGLTFECSCSRRELTNFTRPGYPGTCRNGPTRPGPTATRFRMPETLLCFDDRIQGLCQFDARALGDVVVRRRDGAFAYQLAVVVDDAAQGVTDVVRGADLLESTGWQIALQRALRVSQPRYTHLPLVVERMHGKLSKSRHSLALDAGPPGPQLHAALRLLQHAPPAELQHEMTPAVLLRWAVQAWDPGRARRLREVTVSS